MPSIINAATSGGLISTADTSGVLQLQTASTTALTVTSAQNVGIGTASPASKLDVVGTASFSSTMGVGDFAAASATGLNVRFIGNLTSTDITGVSVSISAPATASNSTNGVYSSLRTTATSGSRGSLSCFYAEQPSIGAGSSVTASNGVFVRNQGNAAISSAYGIRIEPQSGSTLNLGIYNESSSRFNGNIGLNTLPSGSGTGITFPATQSASSDANTLDDYEEGTWTPTISSGSGTITTSSFSGAKYTKIGNIVEATVNITITTVGTAGGSCNFTLPFTSTNTVQIAGYGMEVNTNGAMLKGNLQSSSATEQITMYNNTSPFSLGDGSVFVMTSVYQV
jgi:hypothetical protein